MLQETIEQGVDLETARWQARVDLAAARWAGMTADGATPIRPAGCKL